MGVFRDGLKHLKHDFLRNDRTIVEKLRILLQSHKWHVIIVILVIIDIGCIATELLLVELERVVLPATPKCPSIRERVVDFPFITLYDPLYNTTEISNATSVTPFNSSIEPFNNLISGIANSSFDNETFSIRYTEVYYLPYDKAAANGHKIFKTLEKVFIWISTVILGSFVVEIIFKIILVPKIFKKKLEILDVVVILVSFTMNILIITLDNSVQALAAVFAVFRLWRILEIIGEIVISQKRQFEEIEEKHERRIAELEGVEYVSKKEQEKEEKKKIKKKFICC